MIKGIIGKKLGMTQIYAEDGTVIPVTVVDAGPCTVLSLRTKDKDGYSAVQLGFGQAKKKNTSKAICGHCAAAGLADNPPSVIKEFRLEEDPAVEVGSKVAVDIFEEGKYIDVTGTTKGRGFQGVVKRWNFGGGRASHGGGWLRRPGSIGMCVNPGKVYKGRKMPGQYGSVTRTVQNLKIVQVRLEENLLMIKGAIPGPVGGTVFIRSAIKK